MNLRRTSALQGVMSPAFLFTGVKPNYQKVFGLAFGDYAEVYDGTTNTSKERCLPCIALHPVGNASGSWVFWNLLTKKHLRRSNWTKMVMTDMVIKSVNDITDMELVEEVVEEAAEPAVAIGDAVAEGEVDPELADLPELMDSTSEESDDNEPDDEESDDDAAAPELPVEQRRSARIEARVLPPERLNFSQWRL